MIQFKTVALVMAEIYNKIGKRYALGRRTDPYIAKQIHAVLAGAESVLNVGAGTGSYEPDHIQVCAAEPSLAMINQRNKEAAPVKQAHVENLPFEDDSFSHCMTVLSMHHWQDRKRAFHEIKRVTRKRFIAVTWDPDSDPFWLTRDYFPEIHSLDREIFPCLPELQIAFDRATISTLKIPTDCTDGFLAAYWRHPEAYLDERVRANISTFTKISNLTEGLTQLKSDLKSGKWASRNQAILDSDFMDAGYRILVADLN